MSALILIEPPEFTVVSLTRFKEHHNILHNDDDELIKGYISALTNYMDGATGLLGRAILTQQWEYRIEQFPGGSFYARWIAFQGSPVPQYSSAYPYGIDIPLPPLQSIDSFQYIDANTGSLTDVNTSTYQLVEGGQNARSCLVPAYGQYWPQARDEPGAVRIKFTAGYEDDAVPPVIKQAFNMILSHWYENRETIVIEHGATELPYGARALLETKRIRGF